MGTTEGMARELRRLGGRAVETVRDGGFAPTAVEGARVAYGYAAFPLRRWLTPAGSFSLGGTRLPYFRHPYNRAWLNERTVELAVAFRFLAGAAGGGTGRMLEVGNVLAHYGVTGHDVVDKYERAPGVRNVDVVDLDPGERYDTIVSVSTLEHVGWDERPREPGKAVRACAHLRGLLAPGGRMLVTCPLGHNPHLDAAVRAEALGFPRSHWLRRVSRDNRWEEVAVADVADARYGSPYPNANAVFVGMQP